MTALQRAWGVVSWLAPLLGVFAFAVLYVVAACVYPGGTRADPTLPGFSFVHNYWCDLLDATTYGGHANDARPVARAAMIVFCAGLAVLWMAAPRLFGRAERRAWVVRLAGLGSAAVIPWVGMGFHDLAVQAAGVLGGAAFVTTLTALPAEQGFLRRSGLGVLALIAVNYFIWETRIGIGALPLVQKVAFAAVLAWVVVFGLRLRGAMKAA